MPLRYAPRQCHAVGLSARAVRFSPPLIGRRSSRLWCCPRSAVLAVRRLVGRCAAVSPARRLSSAAARPAEAACRAARCAPSVSVKPVGCPAQHHPPVYPASIALGSWLVVGARGHPAPCPPRGAVPARHTSAVFPSVGDIALSVAFGRCQSRRGNSLLDSGFRGRGAGRRCAPAGCWWPFRPSGKICRRLVAVSLLSR